MNRVWVLCVIVLLSACSDVKVSQDYEQGYNFAGLKTFAWKPEGEHGYGLEDNVFVDKRIRTAIETQLKAKGYELLDSMNPDFFVSYDVTVQQKVTSSGTTGSISLGRSSYGRYGSVGMSTGSQVRAYDEGTLLIDFIQPVEDKLIWRGISTQSVDKHSDPDKSTVIINETVEKMLQQFPPK